MLCHVIFVDMSESVRVPFCVIQTETVFYVPSIFYKQSCTPSESKAIEDDRSSTRHGGTVRFTNHDWQWDWY